MKPSNRIGSTKLVLIALLAFLTLFVASCAPLSLDQISQTLNMDTGLITINPETTPASPADEEASQIEREHEFEAMEETEEQFLLVEEIVILMLCVAILVGIAAHRLRVPYTIGLVLIGLALTLRSPIDINISPALILALLVPPLIFEAAFHLNLRDLRINLVPIMILAIPGVILTTLIVGGIVSFGTGLAIPAALVFGAIVSATDPVSVVALFRKMGVPQRLRILLEGESLFNDGTAIVIFQLMVAAAISGAASFNLAIGVVDFLVVSGGGLAVGLLLGTLVSELIKRIDDYLIETTLTSVLAFGSYLAAEILGVSGVLAVVAAGLVNGNIGPRGMSPTTRIVVFNFWEYAAFLANTFVFLLIGLQIDLSVLFSNWQLILWAIVAILVARAVSIYGLSRIKGQIPSRWKHVLYWGGLRGAISLALALSLPAQLGPAADQLRVMVFGVVLFTLVFQGLTMKPIVEQLGIVEPRTIQQDEYERRQARAVASRSAYEHLQRRRQLGMLSDHTWQRLSPVLNERNRSLEAAVREVMIIDPSVEAEELDTARREYFRAQRSTITSLYRDNVITEDTFSQIAGEIDSALSGVQADWGVLLGNQTERAARINRMMAAVIQEHDIENAVSALNKTGFPVTRLRSTGGFLRNKNVTLLVGFPTGRESAIVETLSRNCRKRVEYLSTLPLGIPGEIASPIPVSVGGAIIFTFAVERFETF